MVVEVQMIGVILLIGIILSLGIYYFFKSLIDLDSAIVCNRRNQKIDISPNCKRYMILAHYNTMQMRLPMSFTSLTDYKPPRWEIVENSFLFNDIELKSAEVKPNPWCYQIVNSTIETIKQNFRMTVGVNTDEIQYDLYLLRGGDFSDGYTSKIVNGTEQDIRNYSFSEDM